MNTEGLPNKYHLGFKKSNVESLLAIAGFFLIGVVLLSSSLLVKGVFSFTKPPKPTSITITNITNNSFTISWKTADEALGYIIYGNSPERLTFSAYDNRASKNLESKYRTIDHSVTLTNLNSETYYYYKIVSNKESYDKVGDEFFEPVKTNSTSPFLDFREKVFTN